MGRLTAPGRDQRLTRSHGASAFREGPEKPPRPHGRLDHLGEVWVLLRAILDQLVEEVLRDLDTSLRCQRASYRIGDLSEGGQRPSTHTPGDIIQSVSESAPGLLPIFRSGNQLKLLGSLFVLAGAEFSIAELERRTGVSQQTISREVGRLGDAGLLSARRSGRMTLVQANQGSPYFPELRRLLLKAAGPSVVLAERLTEVAGVTEAHLFGSWARRYEGELGPPPADVDVLIVGDADPDRVEAVCVEVGRGLGLEVNPVVLSEAEWRDPTSGFVRQLRHGPLVELIAPRA